jgi:hypothetical protein
MMTATRQVVKSDGVTPADNFDFGAGRVDLSRAVDPGFVIDEAGANFVALQSRLWEANYPSVYVPAFLGEMTVRRTLHNTRAHAGSWRISAAAPPKLAIGVPTTITIPADGDAVLDIAIDGHLLANHESAQALIEFTRGSDPAVRLPITVVRRAAAVPLTQSCAPTTIAQKTATNCTITISNPTFQAANVVVADTLAANQLRLVSGSVAGATETQNGLTFSGVLDAAIPPDVRVAPGRSPAGYVPLSSFGIPPVVGAGDETIFNFNVPAFLFGGNTYTRIGFTSNGYAVVGGGSSADLRIANQSFPNPARPNNVLAPFWTDLNPAAAGAMRLGVLTDGTNTWVVLEWEGVPERTSGKLASFEIWIGVDGREDISFVYGNIQGNGDQGFLTVGAENLFGTRGQNAYYNGTGALPSSTTELVVSTTPGTPGGVHVITYSAVGETKGGWTTCAEMSSNAFFGVQTACVNGETVK